ncbi:hypothetical protein Tco_0900927, partial [Tanacetum coccineum]
MTPSLDNSEAVACIWRHRLHAIYAFLEYQLADIFTKALGRNRIEFLINKLGMRSFTPETLKQLADESRMSNTSDKGTTFRDGAARVGMQLRSSPK